MSFNSVKLITIDAVSRRSWLHHVLQTKKMLVSFEVRIERPQQFGYDDDEERTGVLAVADRFKKLEQVLVACSSRSCNNLSTSVLTSDLC